MAFVLNRWPGWEIRGEEEISLLSRLTRYASFVRFSHTVFALPFALTGALLAAQKVPLTWPTVALITVAMFTARTSAMAFNRLVDARFDARNPRTSDREIPRGIVSQLEAVFLVAVGAMMFVMVCFFLNPLCFLLSPLALVIIFWYSLAKRFTAYTQLYLGLALAVAPVGGWLAVGGGLGWEPWLLALGIAMWVAGFDILYSCEDIEFDRRLGLRSIPAKFGIRRSLLISKIFHCIAVVSLAALALVVPLGFVYLVGVFGVALLLCYEQSMVAYDDLTRVKEAFDLNGWVGILYFITTATDLYV